MPKSFNLAFLISKSLFLYHTLISAKPVFKLRYILISTLAPQGALFIFSSILFNEIFLYLSTVLSTLRQNISLGEIKGGFILNSLKRDFFYFKAL